MTTRNPAVLASLFVLAGCFLLLAESSSPSKNADRPHPSKKQRAATVKERPQPADAKHGVGHSPSPNRPADRRSSPPAGGSILAKDGGTPWATSLPVGLQLPAEHGSEIAGEDGSGKPPPKTLPEERPGRLRAPKKAAPILPNSGDEARLRALIRQELPHANPDEIAVWARKLKGWPLARARDLLRLRRKFPLRGENAQPLLIAPLPENPAGIPGNAHPSTRNPIPSRFDPSLSALRRAMDVITNNIANANTPAFKRARVIFAERPPQAHGSHPKAHGSHPKAHGSHPVGLPLPHSTGVQIEAVKRDWTPGQLRKTARRLDLAIDGNGFFAVRDGKQTFYTRRGTLTPGPNRELFLQANGKRYRLCGRDGVISASNHAEISSDGKVSGCLFQWIEESRVVVAQIPLARFPNRDSLQPVGGGLYRTKAAPEFGKPGDAGFGTLKSGHLETSNVNLQRELAEFRKLAEQYKALKAVLDVTKEFDADSPPPGPMVEQPLPRSVSDAGSCPSPNGDSQRAATVRERVRESTLTRRARFLTGAARSRCRPFAKYVSPARYGDDGPRFEKPSPQIRLREMLKGLYKLPDEDRNHLLFHSEDLRLVPEIWERIWGLEMPDVATPYRVHGGVL